MPSCCGVYPGEPLVRLVVAFIALPLFLCEDMHLEVVYIRRCGELKREWMLSHPTLNEVGNKVSQANACGEESRLSASVNQTVCLRARH